MSLQTYLQFNPLQQQQNSFFELSAGSINEFEFFNIDTGLEQKELDAAKPLRKRRDDTNAIINQLYEATLMRRPGEREIVRVGGRKNKNEILGLVNARFVKENHLNGVKYLRDIDLVRGIHTNLKNGEFVLVLRTDGRIVAMSDEAEFHLNKSMRSLYTQCINIFECLDKTDGEKLQSILDSANESINQEHRLICTLRLPKGKRPSRTREDVKTITMAGHFYSCHNSSYDKLFIARCEALVSRTTSGTGSSQMPFISNSMIKLTLNDDMTVCMISSNVKDILGYSRNEIIGNWFGKLLETNDINKFEQILQAHLQRPTNVREIFDMYARYGDSRLTFLCQIRPIRERRSKSIKYSIVAQMIDPSLRNEYLKYVHAEVNQDLMMPKVDSIDLVSPTMPRASEDSIMVESPSLAMGLLMSDNMNGNEFVQHQQQLSPFGRTLSNVVAPFIFDEAPLPSYEHEYDFVQMQHWPTKTFDDPYIKYQFEQELASIDALIDEF